MFKRQEVFESSLNYFNGDELAANVFCDKYALRNEKGDYLELTPEDMHHRLAKEFARVEEKKYKNTNIKPLSKEEIFGLFDKFKYIVPQGSPMFGIGNDHQLVSLSNCFVLTTPEDSYGGILHTDQELVQMSKRRGGVGMDLSKLRPTGSSTKNAARTSTGVPAFMERYSNSIREVGQNGRRGALMLTLSVHHPNIREFTTIKNDLTKVTGANISVRLTNEFLEAVKNNTDYELRFPVDYEEQGIEPQISEMVSAKEIWDLIIKNAHQMAEPGLLFWDNILNESLPDCYSDKGFKTVSTNPCGEIVLSERDSCRLLVINLLSFVENPFTEESYFNFSKFKETVRIAQRLMDDLIDLEEEKLNKIIQKIENDPEPEYLKRNELELWKSVLHNAITGRRTGLGTTAWGDMLAALGIKYGTDESIRFVEEISKTMKLEAYRSSNEMAKEIGPFTIWESRREIFNPFLTRISKEDPELYNDLMNYGRRNIALLTVAPTGSLSILTQTTSGIEPLFMLGYKRRKKLNPEDLLKDKNLNVDFVDQNGDKWQEFIVYHPTIKKWQEVNPNKTIEESPWFGYCAEDINWKNRVKLQGILQGHVDHSISSTLNLPEDISIDEVKTIYETAWESGCKGITVYRKNSRTGVLIEDKPKEKSEVKFEQRSAIKRPKILKGEVNHVKIKGQEFYVTVGLMDNKPYEIFIGENHINEESEKGSDSQVRFRIPKKCKTGEIQKVKRGAYDLITEEGERYRLNGNVANVDIDALTRMISTSLRHGVDVIFIIEQLEKIIGFDNAPKAIVKALKKYIQNGTEVRGETCPSCGSLSLVRQDGCVTCVECGWSRCS